MRRDVSGVVLILLSVGLLMFLFNVQLAGTESKVITVPDDYLTIQEALNNAVEGDTVFVRNGTYYEHVVLKGNVALIGENRESTVIDGNGSGIVVYVAVWETDYGNVSGFTIRGGDYGVYLFWTSNNCVTENIISSNRKGLILLGSGNNVLRDNEIVDNTVNFGVEEPIAPYLVQDIDVSNTVDGKPIYYWVDQHDMQVPTDAGYVALINSTGITVKDLNLTGNHQGMLFAFTADSEIVNVTVDVEDGVGFDLQFCNRIKIRNSRVSSGYVGIKLGIESYHNTLSNNTVSGQSSFADGITLDHNYHASGNNTITLNEISSCRNAVHLHKSDNNTIARNTLVNNQRGLWVESCGGNAIIHNNFINNTGQIEVFESENNTWHNGCEGNYWSNYDGSDLDNDGVGDTYLPWIEVDYFPLMNLYWNPSDINHDLKVEMKDVGKAARAFGTQLGDPDWNCHADVTGSTDLEPDGKVDMRDIGLVSVHFGEVNS